MDQRLLYTEQIFDEQEKNELISKHIKSLVFNFDTLSRQQIKSDLLNLHDLLERY